MAVISQPGSSVKFTNISQIRMKKGDKRFEIVCYRNKVQDWRNGIEKDIDEVVQVPQVFINVGKGELAGAQDLQKYFGTTDVEKAVLEILNKGELQVGGKERQQQQEQLHQAVLQVIATKVINPKNGRPYPASILEKVLDRIDFRFSATKPAKVQALEAIKLLLEAQLIPIVRARMRIRVTDDANSLNAYSEDLKEKMSVVESENTEGSSIEISGLINPSDFRDIDQLVHEKSNGEGLVEVLSVTEEAQE